MALKGLSPRVRGNLRFTNGKVGYHRSIPASAGQPPCWKSLPSEYGVYPRECGATQTRK